MGRRHYAAILLFVFGIVEVYSFSLRTDKNDPITSGKLPEEDKYLNSYLQAMNLDHEDAQKIRREAVFSRSSSERKKQDRYVGNLHRAIEADGRMEAVRQEVRAVGRGTATTRPRAGSLTRRVEEHQAAQEQYDRLIDDYEARGLTRGAAIQRLEREHPDLARRVRP